MYLRTLFRLEGKKVAHINKGRREKKEEREGEEKEEKGRQAQQFVLTNKNNKTQAARIASLLDGMYEQ